MTFFGHIKKLWDIWNIRGSIILSVFVQSFLILFAPSRKQRGGKWVLMISIWLAYLLADWVATFAIGLIFRAESSDILALWAPFLLLHLGGPDLITSFSLEDNEFWIRHLLGLVLQVITTVYVILRSLSQNKLWPPTFMVLIAGIIKYVERNYAFHLASFDHFGDNWEFYDYGENKCLPAVPVKFLKNRILTKSKFKQAMCTLGAFKNLLVGPIMPSYQKERIRSSLSKLGSDDVLQIIEIHLSLFYEILHTKLPVVDSKIGYVFRIVSFGCIFGALLSFSTLRKHYKLGQFDIWLTFGLLIGALVLDFISIMFLIFSDWIVIAHFRNIESKFIDRRRWSNSVSQLDFISYHVKDCPVQFNQLADSLCIKRLIEAIKKILFVNSKDFRKDQEWSFIFSELLLNSQSKKTREETCRGRVIGILHRHENLAESIQKYEYMESLLMWHIATEICFLKAAPENSASSSFSMSGSINHPRICKLLSDYMFYLVVIEPTMMAAVSENWKIVFEHTSNMAKEYMGRSEFQTDFAGAVLSFSDPVNDNRRRQTDKSVLLVAGRLANELISQRNGCPWNLMCKVWVELVCYAAINCKPIIHARQLSKGGELLSLVWLLMNYLDLTPPKEWL